MEKSSFQIKQDALAIFSAGVKAVDAENAVSKAVKIAGETLTIGQKSYDLSKINRVIVLGAGKASAFMAAGLESILGNRIHSGLVCVKYDHGTALKRIELREAGHPVPDANGQAAAEMMLKLAQNAAGDDLVIFLLSGGCSALLPLAWQGISLADKQKAASVMLASGATIYQINTVRKHCSRIKGGRLAQAAYPAKLATLIVSDVVGNDLDVIGSGPTVPDKTTFAQALDVISQLGIGSEIPKAIMDHLQAGLTDQSLETPKPYYNRWDNVQNLIVADNLLAVESARKKAGQLGYNTLVLSTRMEGETRTVAQVHGAIARETAITGNPIAPPACILSGGETTVTIKGDGLGGRNMEFVLAGTIDIAGYNNIVILSAGSDGTDGPTDAAGAIGDGTTVARAEKIGLDPGNFLGRNDSYNFFKSLDDLIITGPTHTNVMDLRIVLVATAPGNRKKEQHQ